MKVDVYKNKKKLFSIKPEKVLADLNKCSSSVHVVFPKAVNMKKDDELKIELIIEE